MDLAAKVLKVELRQFPVRGPNEFESAFETMEQRHIEAVEVDDDAMLYNNIRAISVLATQRRLLSIGSEEHARAGGLIAYGVEYLAMFRRSAAFVDKILKGIKPADIPIEQATEFELVINLKTAKALGLMIPETLLATADEVIQ
jgi:putative tryptophan/tyrosine transport system substrate-binding protein